MILAKNKYNSYVSWYGGHCRRSCEQISSLHGLGSLPSGKRAEQCVGSKAALFRIVGTVGGETRSVSAVRHKTAKKVSKFLAVLCLTPVRPWRTAPAGPSFTTGAAFAAMPCSLRGPQSRPLYQRIQESFSVAAGIRDKTIQKYQILGLPV